MPEATFHLTAEPLCEVGLDSRTGSREAGFAEEGIPSPERGGAGERRGVYRTDAGV